MKILKQMILLALIVIIGLPTLTDVFTISQGLILLLLIHLVINSEGERNE